MSVFVFARFSSNISACSVRHGSWPAYIASVDFELHVLNNEVATPMWIYFRHPKALSEHGGAEHGNPVDGTVLNKFEDIFSINATSYTLNCDSPIGLMEAHTGDPDENKFELLDLQFRIGAIRQQLQCLAEKMNTYKSAGSNHNSRAKIEEIHNSASETLCTLLNRFEKITTQSRHHQQ